MKKQVTAEEIRQTAEAMSSGVTLDADGVIREERQENAERPAARTTRTVREAPLVAGWD